MSSVAQHSVSIPAGATAVQVASLGSIGGKLGPISLRFSMLAATGFDGKPKAVDPGIFTFEESADQGKTWTELGTSTTVAAEKNVTLLPAQSMFRILAKTTAGKGGQAKVDVHYTGRFGGGQLEFRTFGGKDGFSVAGATLTDEEAVIAGTSTSTAPGAFPSATILTP